MAEISESRYDYRFGREVPPGSPPEFENLGTAEEPFWQRATMHCMCCGGFSSTPHCPTCRDLLYWQTIRLMHRSRSAVTF